MIKLILGSLFLILSISEAQAASASGAIEEVEPGYSYRCGRQDGGNWGYPGDAPGACEAAAYGNSYKAKHVYHDYILNKTGMFSYERDENGKYQRTINEEGRKELARYATNMHNFVRIFADNYIQDKAIEENRDLSSEEHAMFVKAVLAMVEQESFFSHYRYEDTNKPWLTDEQKASQSLFFQVGDKSASRPGYYWARGLMQFHPEKHDVAEHEAFDLGKSIYHGLDYFYLNWRRAATGIGRASECKAQINDPEHGPYWENVSKATYSAHNGGYGRICRWFTADAKHETFKLANPGCWWGRVQFGVGNTALKNSCDEVRQGKAFIFDLDFRARLTGEAHFSQWKEKYLDDQYIASFPVDYDCIMNGFDLCAMPKERHGDYIQGQIVRLDYEGVFEERNFCVLSEVDNKFHCTADEKAVACLNKIEKIESMDQLFRLKLKFDEVQPVIHSDRNSLCEGSYEGFVSVGGFIRVQKNITVRETPLVRNPIRPSESADNRFWVKDGEGSKLLSVQEGEIYQVLDFAFNADPNFCESNSQCRFYKVAVKHPNSDKVTEGYIFGGSESGRPWQEWAVPVDYAEAAEVADVLIPTKGDSVQVFNSEGLPFFVKDLEQQLLGSAEYVEMEQEYKENMDKYKDKVMAYTSVVEDCRERNGFSRFIFSGNCPESLEIMETNLVEMRQERPQQEVKIEADLLEESDAGAHIASYSIPDVVTEGEVLEVEGVHIIGESDEIFLKVRRKIKSSAMPEVFVSGFIPAGRVKDLGGMSLREVVELFVKRVGSSSEVGQ